MAKSNLLLASLSKFFDEPANREQLHDIIGRGKGPSLRKLEWFVTNYSKNNHVTFTAPNGKTFTVHVAYKSSLDGYSKKLFDPFCRTERIEFQGLTTTCAQLNFLRWAISNGIVNVLKGMEEKQSPLGTEAENIHNKIDTGCSRQ
jgi:hypothetical protein